MTKYSTSILALLFGLVFLTFSSCEDDDDPLIPNEEEVITDVIYTLTPTTTGETVLFTFLDRDGDGGMDPTIGQVGVLRANTTYTGTLLFQNAVDSTDVENVSDEVLEEALEHQVFFQKSTGLNVTIAYADTDTEMNPLGLTTTFTTGASSSGTMTITLRHEPNKSAPGVTIDNPSAAGGTTDAMVNFTVAF